VVAAELVVLRSLRERRSPVVRGAADRDEQVPGLGEVLHLLRRDHEDLGGPHPREPLTFPRHPRLVQLLLEAERSVEIAACQSVFELACFREQAEQQRPRRSVVAEASVGKSISMKRFATRARGRSSQIVKPFSRLRIVVREVEEKDA